MKRDFKNVKSYGLPFIVHSSRERETTIEGRHFFVIGRNSHGWTLFEHDRSIGEHGQAKPIGRKFERIANTMALVAEIRRLVETGERLPSDCRPPWEIDEPRFRALLPVETRYACGRLVHA
jgi:hypothetical protein